MGQGLRPTDVLCAAPELQVLTLPDHRLLMLHGAGASLIGGVAAGDLASVISAVDGVRTVEAVCSELAGEEDRAEVWRLLELLAGEALRRIEPAAGLAARPPVAPSPGVDQAPARETGRPPVLVLGHGAAGEALARRLAEGDVATVSRLGVASFEGCAEESFRARDRELWLAPSMTAPPAAVEAAGEILYETGAGALAARFREVELVIAALEGVPYRALFEVQAAGFLAGVPVLFALPGPDGAVVGPTVVAGATPCLTCSLVARFRFVGLPPLELVPILEHLRTTPLAARAAFGGAVEATILEARAVLAESGHPRLLAGVLALPSGGGDPRRLRVPRLATCPCMEASLPTSAGARVRALSHMAEAERAWALERRPHLKVAEPEGRQKVLVLGGGTAGYLTALALRRYHPSLPVTLIESPEVPVIGVGEATTPLMPQFLHADLGLSIHELFRQVEPTLKLGIRFLWGPPEQGGFHYPFGTVHVLEPRLYEGDLLGCSLRSRLMAAGVVPVIPAGEADPTSYLDVEVAYHLENRRFVGYLERQARSAGIERLEATIARVEVTEDGGEVRCLRGTDGRGFSADLYVDCSGFHSLLLGEALGSPFVGYERSLFTDSAVVAAAPHGGYLKPYTQAETLDAGWCWSVPQREAEHRGYVYCSAFLEPEAAVEEMRRACPGMGEPRAVRFRPGRRQHFWKGNVVALGNAYGFVEPLESTALHMLIRQIALLVEALPPRGRQEGIQALLNRRVADHWDYICWFLALHFRFNRYRDTAFWRECQEHVDVSRYGELIEAFRQRGPLSYDPPALAAFDYPDPLWGAEGVDVLLMGQGVPAHLPRPAASPQEWAELSRLHHALAARALTQERALEVLAERPEMLESFARGFRRVGPVCRVSRPA